MRTKGIVSGQLRSGCAAHVGPPLAAGREFGDEQARALHELHHATDPLQGIFVAGTDTGIGKTVVAAAIVAAFRSAGIDAVPMKPIQTGCEDIGGSLRAPDLQFVLNVAQLAPAPDEMELMCPYRFRSACSPHLAAEREGRAISLERIAECFDMLQKRHEVIVVEGAGGILVPIAKEAMMLDLMAELRLPALVVARPGLGTINHTLLSLHELARAGLRTRGVVFNETTPTVRGYIEEDNRDVVERLGKTRVLAWIPFINEIADNPNLRATLLSACGSNFIKEMDVPS